MNKCQNLNFELRSWAQVKANPCIKPSTHQMTTEGGSSSSTLSPWMEREGHPVSHDSCSVSSTKGVVHLSSTGSTFPFSSSFKQAFQ